MIIILIARVTDRVMDNKVWKISGMDTKTNNNVKWQRDVSIKRYMHSVESGEMPSTHEA